MDPIPNSSPTWKKRFPRPRGDGPIPASLQESPTGVSPPTRGWTGPTRCRVEVSSGFPAHAGMDLFSDGIHSGVARFPRPRGDGPRRHRRDRWPARVSPPTRGWTSGAIGVQTVTIGFPAHAGMDPPMGPPTPGGSWFPRPRGDGPANGTANTWWELVSPPTRGWTLAPVPWTPTTRGFPAHAGMDPDAQNTTAMSTRFPRPRGDGPEDNARGSTRQKVSPPTRGWTLRPPSTSAHRGGFPAHAGMDPTPSPTTARIARFPRPRGDGPPLSRTESPDRKVSPPTRGWTLTSSEFRTRWLGFPAHAGMDLHMRRRRRPTLRFPRPRGDGPCTSVGINGRLRVSPPTRGWTATKGVVE